MTRFARQATLPLPWTAVALARRAPDTRLVLDHPTVRLDIGADGTMVGGLSLALALHGGM